MKWQLLLQSGTTTKDNTAKPSGVATNRASAKSFEQRQSGVDGMTLQAVMLCRVAMWGRASGDVKEGSYCWRHGYEELQVKVEK